MFYYIMNKIFPVTGPLRGPMPLTGPQSGGARTAPVELQTHTGSTLDNCDLTSDLLTSGSLHPERLLCALTLVLIAQSVFLSER